MNKHSIGEKLIMLSAFSAFALSVIILVYKIITTKGAFLIVDPHGVALCIALLVTGFFGKKYVDSLVYGRESQVKYPLISGAVSVLLSLTYFIRRISVFMLIPTVSGFLCLLTLPVSVLFLVGVLLRGKPGQQS
ncbi:MAG: hypothetical protein E7610_00145 [Ruminococcaceae bacterium]|nr:hypothetical protein [Oscillospiraceae bacterium]